MDNFLSSDLGVWEMFLNADAVVKGVLLSLVFASFVTWMVWLAKSFELFLAKKDTRAAITIITRVHSLKEACNCHFLPKTPASHLITAASTELSASQGIVSTAGIKERISMQFYRIEMQFNRRINAGTGLLASIGATAPFVGLFGTVWGIMNSFIGISKHHTTNLAVVAPGIAEALLTTAVGLAAAIPAVLTYNVITRSIAGYRTLFGDIIDPAR